MKQQVSGPRELTKEETAYILSLKDEDITASLIRDLFARKPDGSDPKFRTNDYFKLPTSRFNTKKEVYTTIGIYIANVFLIMPNFSEIFHYINEPLTADKVEDIEKVLSSALYNDKITTDSMADYYNRIQWLGGDRVMSLISPSLTGDILKEPKDIIKERDRLFKEHAKDLDPDSKKNAIVGAKIEKELVKKSEEYIMSHDGAENFESKAKINVKNNYKNMNVMKGAIKSSFDGKYRINKSNYNSGISKEEYASFSDSAVLGSYMRAVNTAKGGYLAKETNQGLSSVRLSAKGSNCGTTKTEQVLLTKSNKKDYINRFIVDHGNIVELTDDNWSKYENKVVNMRSPLYCIEKQPCYCNICVGNSPYKMNMENIGSAFNTIPNAIMYVSMKAFHDTTIKTSEIDIDDIFLN